MLGPGFMALAVALLLAVMSASFLNVPWPKPPEECGGELCEIPIVDDPLTQDTEPSVTAALFGPYAILVVVIALVLATCMIGGVYLAKMEGGAPPR